MEVEGYEDLYWVSNKGKVKSKRKILKPFKSRKYLVVKLHKNNIPKSVLIHRLVAKHFMPCEDKKEINHIDGNTENNCVENLEWVTHKENIQHAVNNNLIKYNRGESHHNCKVKQKDIELIKKLYTEGYKRREIIKITGVSLHIVKDVLQRRSWKHI